MRRPVFELGPVRMRLGSREIQPAINQDPAGLVTQTHTQHFRLWPLKSQKANLAPDTATEGGPFMCLVGGPLLVS